jgi:hypothetical protein
MTTITDLEIKQKGLGVLMDALGEVDAERFIMLLNREPFDYTQWQRTIFENIGLNQISADAMALRNKKYDDVVAVKHGYTNTWEYAKSPCLPGIATPLIQVAMTCCGVDG